ncbi:MAG: hypothetical protein GY861_22395 [bacterium]|nr:hypothetical protein [bacterium]
MKIREGNNRKELACSKYLVNGVVKDVLVQEGRTDEGYWIEGGLTVVFERDGEEHSMMFGYTELGEWVEEIDNISVSPIGYKKLYDKHFELIDSGVISKPEFAERFVKLVPAIREAVALNGGIMDVQELEDLGYCVASIYAAVYNENGDRVLGVDPEKRTVCLIK